MTFLFFTTIQRKYFAEYNSAIGKVPGGNNSSSPRKYPVESFSFIILESFVGGPGILPTIPTRLDRVAISVVRP